MPYRMIAAGTTLLLLLAGCSSSTPAAATPVAGASATPQAVTTPAPTVPATSQGPFVMPSFAGDPDLAAKFPKTVAGKPVTAAETARFVDFLRAFNTTQAEIDKISQAFNAIGIDLNSVVLGSAVATVNASPVNIFAFRVPGQDAGKMIQGYALLSAGNANAGDKLSVETVGGKNVSVVRDSAGTASDWLYANGEVLWSINSSDQADAEAVFAALP
ncbi:MAG: hypothetical protein M3067_13640 [Chloroflexota bacterium]|nr:hypothetical protein [Chloroflexota bacterium]